ncbi:MAG: PfkB family carbohydrate kinase [bacterium]
MGNAKKPQAAVVGGAYVEAGQAGSSGGLVPGGMPVRVSLELARMGARVFFLSSVGLDEGGAAVVSELRKSRVNVDFVERRKSADTARLAPGAGSGGADYAAGLHGAGAHMDRSVLLAARAMVSSCDLVIVFTDVPPDTVRFALALAHHFGIPAMVKVTGPGSVSRRLLSEVDVLVVDVEEAQAMTYRKIRGTRDAAACVGLLLGFGAGAVVISVRGFGVACGTDPAAPAYVPAPRTAGRRAWNEAGLVARTAFGLARGVSLQTACFAACRYAAAGAEGAPRGTPPLSGTPRRGALERPATARAGRGAARGHMKEAPD